MTKSYEESFCTQSDECYYITPDKICDGVNDCTEGSDEDWETCCLNGTYPYYNEERCRYNCTTSDPNKNWIPFSSYCDGLFSLGTSNKLKAVCLDGSDENFDRCCKSKKFAKYNDGICQKFKCASDPTIEFPLKFFCDGSKLYLNADKFADCPDGSDEILETCCQNKA